MADKKLGERVASLEQGFETICQDIKDIKRILLGRPTWAVLMIITALTTISTSLALYVLINR